MRGNVAVEERGATIFARWPGAVLCGFTAAVTGCMELWLAAQPQPDHGSWSSPFYWSPLPVLLIASLFLFAGGLGLVPVRTVWTTTFAGALLLVFCRLLHVWSPGCWAVAVFVVSITWFLSSFTRARIAAVVSSAVLTVWWVPVALIGVRQYYWPAPNEIAGGYFCSLLVLTAALVVGSLLAGIRLLKTSQ